MKLELGVSMELKWGAPMKLESALLVKLEGWYL